MTRPAVKKLLEKLAAMLTAAALAEEGVSEKARQVVEEGGRDEPPHPAGGGR
jgi:hypothetical protein